MKSDGPRVGTFMRVPSISLEDLRARSPALAETLAPRLRGKETMIGEQHVVEHGDPEVAREFLRVTLEHDELVTQRHPFAIGLPLTGGGLLGAVGSLKGMLNGALLDLLGTAGGLGVGIGGMIASAVAVAVGGSSAWQGAHDRLPSSHRSELVDLLQAPPKPASRPTATTGPRVGDAPPAAPSELERYMSEQKRNGGS